MPRTLLVYPHQLFRVTELESTQVVLIEDPLFFTQYQFHTQKLILHRASMKCFADECKRAGASVTYLECHQLKSSEDIAVLLKAMKIERIEVAEFDDYWLETRVRKALNEQGIAIRILPSPGFLTSIAASKQFFEAKGRYYFTEFYIEQRKRLGILIEDGAPKGGKWSFDHDNRKKLPKDLRIPDRYLLPADEFTREAQSYVAQHFPKAPGNAKTLLYPHSRAMAKKWLKDFVTRRVAMFGDYEDAISTKEPVLFHSQLTPMLNIGLLTPAEVISEVNSNPDIPLNSLEGFVRQVIGWREYMRAMYHLHGRAQRTCNFWQNTKPIPQAFYDATTGVLPVDTAIRNVLDTGYAHHIERLMLLGNFMLLCEIHPTAVYKWFMELFVDAYDWVMVPNVYAMSQYADGGKMTTKPYVSGSSYVLKMSDYKKADWCLIWDALYWNHVAKHKKFYAFNNRMSMMAAMCDKLGPKLAAHQARAEAFLSGLHDSVQN